MGRPVSDQALWAHAVEPANSLGNAFPQNLKGRGQRSSIMLKKKRINADVIGQSNPNSQRERANIERKSAEQKQYHGLSRARYWGRAKVTIQEVVTCLVVNYTDDGAPAVRPGSRVFGCSWVRGTYLLPADLPAKRQ